MNTLKPTAVPRTADVDLTRVFDSFVENQPSEERIRVIRDEVSGRVRSALNRKKGDRSDVGTYNLNLKMRQDVINERVVDWSLGSTLDPDFIVLDACAGPGGSYQAVSRRGGQWIGNEIATETAEYLRSLGAKVHVGSAEQLEFDSTSFDAVLFVYAMNNIQATGTSMSEAARVLKPGGTAVIADPGPTQWISDIVLYATLEGGALLPDIRRLITNKKTFDVELPDYFAKHCPVQPREYAAKILEGLYDLELSAIPDILNKIIEIMYANYAQDFTFKRFQRMWTEIMNTEYWAVILRHAQKNNLMPGKLGVLSAYMARGQEEWGVTPIHDVDFPHDPSQLSQHLYRLRNKGHELSESLIHPNGVRAAKNIITPVMTFSKAV